MSNAGRVQIDGPLVVDANVSITNAAGGSIVNNSTSSGGSVVNGAGGSIVNNSTFAPAGLEQGDGVVSGRGVSRAVRVVAGRGAGVVGLGSFGSMTLRGALAADQVIVVSSQGQLVLGGDVSSAGVISFGAELSGYYSYLYLNGHALTNTGRVEVTAGPGPGAQ